MLVSASVAGIKLPIYDTESIHVATTKLTLYDELTIGLT
jgi:hypothetical protein